MPDPEMTPEQQTRLRRLLADARHADPVPVDVAARLDRVLEQLGRQEGRVDPAPTPTATSPGRVVDLDARRRRWRRGLLVAAAAVVVVGVGTGVAHLPGSGGSTTSASTSADSEADSGVAGPVPEAAGAGAADRRHQRRLDAASTGAPAGTGSLVTPPGGTDGTALPRIGSRTSPLALTRTGFAHQVRRARLAAPGAGAGPRSPAGRWLCEPAAWGPGELLAASYGGAPVVLAYRPARGDTQVVDLLRCGTAEVIRSTTLSRH